MTAMFPFNYVEQSVHFINLNCGEKSSYCPTLAETNNHPDGGKLPKVQALHKLPCICMTL